MPKLSTRYSRFSYSDYKTQYANSPLHTTNPHHITVWHFWNNKAEKYYYPEEEDHLDSVDSLQVMLAYEHEYTLFLAKHPEYVYDMIPEQDLDGAIFVVFSSFALYWKQFLAKIIGLGVAGHLEGRKIFIFTCYGWKKARLMDVLAAQYGFQWRLCADMEQLGYYRPDILLSFEYDDSVTLSSVLKETALRSNKDSRKILPTKMSFLVAPCGAEDFKVFMDVAWKLALKQFSQTQAHSKRVGKDFRQKVGRSSWFSQLYSLYLNGKIEISPEEQFIETSQNSSKPVDAAKISGVFGELSPMLTAESKNMFVDLNLDKVLNYNFDYKEYDPEMKPAYTLFFDLIEGDGFDYSPPMKWIMAETLLHVPKNFVLKESRNSYASHSSNPVSRLSFLASALTQAEHSQENVFHDLHEDFQVDLSHVLGDTLKHGYFFKPVATFKETVSDDQLSEMLKQRKDVLLQEAIATGQLDKDQTINLKNLAVILAETKKQIATVKKAAKLSRKLSKSSLPKW